MRNPDRQLQVTFWLMIAIQTITALDVTPAKGPRKLPAPRAYVAAVILWAIFGVIADAGGERAAAALAWMTLLSGAIMGTMGKTLTDFLATVANLFAAPKPPPSSGGGGGGGGTAPGPTGPQRGRLA